MHDFCGWYSRYKTRGAYRHKLPSLENLYLLYKYVSVNTKGFCLSLKTRALRKEPLKIRAPSSIVIGIPGSLIGQAAGLYMISAVNFNLTCSGAGLQCRVGCRGDPAWFEQARL